MEGVDNCIFCKIVSGEVSADKVYEDDRIIAFKDIEPKAPVHVLVIPKQHVESLAHLSPGHADLMTHLTMKLKDIAYSLGLEKGFQTRVHTGKAGGQEVFHLHYHIMGG